MDTKSGTIDGCNVQNLENKYLWAYQSFLISRIYYPCGRALNTYSNGSYTCKNWARSLVLYLSSIFYDNSGPACLSDDDVCREKLYYSSKYSEAIEVSDGCNCLNTLDTRSQYRKDIGENAHSWVEVGFCGDHNNRTKWLNYDPWWDSCYYSSLEVRIASPLLAPPPIAQPW